MAGGPMGMPSSGAWRQPQAPHARGRSTAQRQPFSGMDGSYRTSVSTTRSDRSDGTVEVENLLAQTGHASKNAQLNGFGGVMQQRVSTAQTRGEYDFHTRQVSDNSQRLQLSVNHPASEQDPSSSRQERQWDNFEMVSRRSVHSDVLVVQLKRAICVHYVASAAAMYHRESVCWHVSSCKERERKQGGGTSTTALKRGNDGE